MKRAFQTIATHSGSFHADEALGLAMLRKLPEFSDSRLLFLLLVYNFFRFVNHLTCFIFARLIRTRNNDVLATADLVLDVGGVYDPERHRYGLFACCNVLHSVTRRATFSLCRTQIIIKLASQKRLVMASKPSCRRRV